MNANHFPVTCLFDHHKNDFEMLLTAFVEKQRQIHSNNESEAITNASPVACAYLMVI